VRSTIISLAFLLARGKERTRERERECVRERIDCVCVCDGERERERERLILCVGGWVCVRAHEFVKWGLGVWRTTGD